MSVGGAVTVAAVQSTPVFLDRDATVERLVADVKDAATAGARLIVFPEAIVRRGFSVGPLWRRARGGLSAAAPWGKRNG